MQELEKHGMTQKDKTACYDDRNETIIRLVQRNGQFKQAHSSLHSTETASLIGVFEIEKFPKFKAFAKKTPLHHILGGFSYAARFICLFRKYLPQPDGNGNL